MSSPGAQKHTAVFPGSFDPVSFGHLDVIRRGRRLFDRIVVGVGQNPGKAALFTPEERIGMIRELVAEMEADEPDEAPVTVEGFSGLTIDFAKRMKASALLRGIRNLSDLQSEVQQAVTNRQLAGIETAFVVAGQSFAYTSSSLIKQIAATSQDGDRLEQQLGEMVPPKVIEALRGKQRERHPVIESLREALGVDDG